MPPRTPAVQPLLARRRAMAALTPDVHAGIRVGVLSRPQQQQQQQRRHLGLHYLSSPAKESQWLSRYGPHARGGAMLTANMAPRVQAVAAEEGLLTWMEASTRAQADARRAALERASWKRPVEVTGTSTISSAAASDLVARQPRPGPRIRDARPPERDDTPGLIAFSCFLLLPLAFQLGRYVEGRENPWPAAEAAIRRALGSAVDNSPTNAAADGVSHGQQSSAGPGRTIGARVSSLMWDSSS